MLLKKSDVLVKNDLTPSGTDITLGSVPSNIFILSNIPVILEKKLSTGVGTKASRFFITFPAAFTNRNAGVLNATSIKPSTSPKNLTAGVLKAMSIKSVIALPAASINFTLGNSIRIVGSLIFLSSSAIDINLLNAPRVRLKNLVTGFNNTSGRNALK